MASVWVAGTPGGGKQGTTNAHAFFESLRANDSQGVETETASTSVGVVAMGVNDPLNVGSIFRLMGCFGATQFIHCHIGRACAGAGAGDLEVLRSVPERSQESCTVSTGPVSAQATRKIDVLCSDTNELLAVVNGLLVRVHTVQSRIDKVGHSLHKKGRKLPKEFWRGGNNSSNAFWRLPPIEAIVRTTARGTESLFYPFDTVHVSSFIHSMSKPRRPPFIFIETATAAVSINDFQFPPRCTIVVGSEEKGVPSQVLQSARLGYDSIVFIPMPGPHPSLNVVTALTCALFEYRKQWPAT
eukprot:m.306665 g.306665  ORF g.306665 m.306665 type:complete len:299 (-) comp16352_c0_seq7:3852-4748(-)